MSPLDRLRAALADRYRLERELGRGGMATVYLAARPPARPPGRPQGPAPRARRRRSAPSGSSARSSTTARLQHPHILPLHRLRRGRTGRLYYVMPYVEGGVAARPPAPRGPAPGRRGRPHRDARSPTRSTTPTAHGIVHRDIKPENILLRRGPRAGRPTSASRRALAAAGRRRGSPRPASPSARRPT